jgi:hypothetical protein
LADEQTKKDIDQLFIGRNNKSIDFAITKGRYYVDGVLCENDDYVLYSKQANYPGDDLASGRANLLFYLDVWERPLSYVEDDSIREVALSGADTAARTRVEWQIRVWPLKEEDRANRRKELTEAEIKKNWADWVSFFQPANRGRLRAGVKNSEGTTASEPCIIHPDARYRGAENQLYRVEIHRGGAAGEATFKWSRENGSVTFRILNLTGNRVRLADLGRDNHLGLKVNDWVEIVDDGITLQNKADNLFQVAEVEPIDMLVTLKVPEGVTLRTYDETSTLHPYLRRWDHKGDAKAGGAIVVTESDTNWIALEDNIQIQFPGPKDTRYSTGDYWLIPARTATGDIEWPKDAKALPVALPPQGIEHHYAPLAIWTSPDQIKDARFSFTPLAKK